MITIIDDLISSEEADKLEKICLAPDTSYYFSSGTVYSGMFNNLTPTEISLRDYPHTGDTHQMIHYLWKDGKSISSKLFDFLPMMRAVSDKIGTENLHRAKINLTTTTRNDFWYTPPHIDVKGVDSYTVIYYVNDSEGPTVIFNEKFEEGKIYKEGDLTCLDRIYPKKGRVIIFDGQILHAVIRPTNDYRVIVNMNWFKRDNKS